MRALSGTIRVIRSEHRWDPLKENPGVAYRD
jgi:hypothetical protein